MKYYSIIDCIEHPGDYNTVIGNNVSGTFHTENGNVYDDNDNCYTDEDLWMITSWEEENSNFYYEKID